MTLNSFLLIDGALILIALPLIFFKQSTQGGFFLKEIINRKSQLQQPSINLPIKEELLKLERISKKEGSGIDFHSLIGVWRFLYVWKPGTNSQDSITSAFLRIFSAKLEIKKDPIITDHDQFSISNSIQFGILEITFQGSGRLKGKQPLLTFSFDLIQLKVASKSFLSKSFEKPEKSKMPFFSLIAMNKSCEWLSARGRGGGMALWIKDSIPKN
tara:strand:- start:473 stop:1114 length:642 start_codon:yes stop_codon:yes gene_type:complete